MKLNDLFSGRIFTISNFLSLLRVLIAPLIAYTLHAEKMTGLERYKYYSLIIIFIVILTDYLDGFIARLLNQVSRLGQFLDPIADKICGYTIGFLLCYYKGFPVWILLIVMIRDIVAIIGGFLLFANRDVQVRPNAFGKWMVGAMGTAGVLHIMSPKVSVIGFTLQQISIYVFLVLIIISTAVFMKTYYKVYFNEEM